MAITLMRVPKEMRLVGIWVFEAIFSSQSFIFSHKHCSPLLLSHCRSINVYFFHYKYAVTVLVLIPGFSCNICHERTSVPLLIFRPICGNYVSSFPCSLLLFVLLWCCGGFFVVVLV